MFMIQFSVVLTYYDADYVELSPGPISVQVILMALLAQEYDTSQQYAV